jgi:hypothetical protein
LILRDIATTTCINSSTNLRNISRKAMRKREEEKVWWKAKRLDVNTVKCSINAEI